MHLPLALSTPHLSRAALRARILCWRLMACDVYLAAEGCHLTFGPGSAGFKSPDATLVTLRRCGRSAGVGCGRNGRSRLRLIGFVASRLSFNALAGRQRASSWLRRASRGYRAKTRSSGNIDAVLVIVKGLGLDIPAMAAIAGCILRETILTLRDGRRSKVVCKVIVSCLGMLLSVHFAFAAEVTGAWRGSLTVRNPDGTVRDFAAMMVLNQSGSSVTGWAGESEDDQNPVVKGAQVDDKLTLVFVRSGLTLNVDVTINNNKMVGIVTRSDGLRMSIQLSQEESLR